MQDSRQEKTTKKRNTAQEPNSFVLECRFQQDFKTRSKHKSTELQKEGDEREERVERSTVFTGSVFIKILHTFKNCSNEAHCLIIHFKGPPPVPKQTRTESFANHSKTAC
jgi:hypothetical protein